jgi:anti-anti-sigma factor
MDARLVERIGPRSFRLFGELDLARVGELDQVLGRETEEGGDLRLDLSEVEFIDSSVIGVLIRAAQTLEGSGRLVLVSSSRAVRLALDIIGVNGRSNIDLVD